MEIPFMWDIVFLTLALPLLEVIILRQNYRIMSPVTIFCAAFFLLYSMPYLVHFYITPDSHLSRLSNSEVIMALNVIRCFIYPLFFILVSLMFRVAKLQPNELNVDFAAIKHRAIFVFLFFCLTSTLTLGTGVGFSPSAMIDRAINPRAYTYIKAGLGPLTHLHSGVQFSLLVLASVMIFLSGKSIRSMLFFGLCTFGAFLGGGKSSIVLPFIILIVIWQKMTSWQKNIFSKLYRTMMIGILGMVLVILGFAFLGTPGERVGFKDAAARIPGYHREAYYLSRVLEYFPWSSEYPVKLLQDTLIAPIPRAIWKSKPGYGIWIRYFRPAFEPNTELYHTSTFGCLTEAHMFFGRFGPYIYGIVWAFFLYKLYVYILLSKNLFKVFLVSTSSFWIYLLLRTGFSGTNTSIMVIYLFIGWFLLRKTGHYHVDEPIYEETLQQEPAQ